MIGFARFTNFQLVKINQSIRSLLINGENRSKSGGQRDFTQKPPP